MIFLDFIQSNRDEKVGNDTVEGIAFSRDTAVIMTGVFVNEEEVAVGAVAVADTGDGDDCACDDDDWWC